MTTALKQVPLVLAIAALAVAETGTKLTPAEQEQALKSLAQSRDGVLNAVKGLSDAQWKFKPGPDRWSAAEVVEHLALIEELVTQNVLPHIEAAPPGKPDRDVNQADAMILAKLADRITKYKAPPAAEPTGRWTPAQALEHLLAARKQTIALFQSMPDPRNHVIDHPAFGPMDGYEWVLAVAGHCARHTKQILEVKADPHFPVN